MTKYQKDDVCIVSYGCLLPGADNAEDFFQLMLEQRSQIREVEGPRFEDFDPIYSPDRETPESSYAKIAAWIEDEVFERCAQQNRLDVKTSSQLEIMAVEAMRQAMAGTNIDPMARGSIILGFMNPENRFFRQHFYREYPKMEAAIRAAEDPDEDKFLQILDTSMRDFCPYKTSDRYAMSTSVLSRLKEQFQVKGEACYVDAACASSLAAIDLAVKKLKLGEVDYVISGGIENNLTSGSFVLFSAVGALAPDQCRPFDERASGIVQGEGAVVFVLKRLSDAVRDGDQIEGVIRGCGGSSDGRRGSLFEPTSAGQTLAYKRAYSHLESNRVDYIEGHGTGTMIGDYTELKSLAGYFTDLKTPIGSLKSLIGHTKGTAGAASILKCLLSMKNKKLPGSRYFEKLPKGVAMDLFVNKETLKLRDRDEPYRMSVSSFGFGGTNYHMIVDEYKEKSSSKEILRARQKKAPLLCAYHYVGADEFDELAANSSVRVPPKSKAQIDRFQLLGLYAAEKTLQEANIQPRFLERREVSVISASSTGLDSLIMGCQRLAYRQVEKRFGDLPEHLLKRIIAVKEEYPQITEDSGPGILNNVIAGRVCNWFDFKGFNYNVDADLASPLAAFDKACLEAQFQDQMIVLVAVEETFDPKTLKVQRSGVHCFVIAPDKVVEKECLPVLAQVDQALYSPDEAGGTTC